MVEDGLARMTDIAAMWILLIALMSLAADRVRVRVRVPNSGGTRPRWIARSLSTLSVFVAMASPAGAARKRNGPPLPGSSAAPETPWSETSGSPLPLVRTGAIEPGVVSPKIGDSPPWRQAPESLHPAVHSGRARSARVTPLFPRHSPRSTAANEHSGEDRTADRERAESMRAHPAGKGMPSEDRLPNVHRVTPGESLWTIAEDALGTKDPVRIARYWHKVHRANRVMIGPDPNLLLPGQQLTLPREQT